ETCCAMVVCNESWSQQKLSGAPCSLVSAGVSEMRFCPMCREPLVSCHLGGMERLACSAKGCEFVFWNNPVPVVAAVVEHEDRIILGRNATWPEGFFGLISGYLERDESPEEGMLREVNEELGLDGEIVSHIGHYP